MSIKAVVCVGLDLVEALGSVGATTRTLDAMTRRGKRKSIIEM